MNITDTLRALLAAATPGPWEFGSTLMGNAIRSNRVKSMRVNGYADDLRLIVELRNHAEALLAVVDAARCTETTNDSLVVCRDLFKTRPAAWCEMCTALATLEKTQR